MGKQLQSEKNLSKENQIDIWRGINIPDSMIKDAFPALALALLQEFMMSTDTKHMIFFGMIHNLKQMGYSEEELNEFRKAISECFKKFHKPNGFMG